MIWGDEEYEMVAHGHLLLASPKKGVLKMLSLRPDNYEPEPWMPHDTHWYTTTSWDISQLWAELTGMVDTFTEEGNFEKLVQENVNEEIELDLKTDILDLLDGRVSMASLTVDPTRINGTSTVVGLGVKDKEASREVIVKLMEKFNGRNDNDDRAQSEIVKYRNIEYWTASEDGQEERAERRRQRMRERAERRGRPDMSATIRMPNPAFALIGDSFVITDSVTAMKRVIETIDGSHEALQNDREFVEIAEHMTLLLGSDMPCAVAYNQPRHQFQMLLDMAGEDSIRGFVDSSAAADEDDEDDETGAFRTIMRHVKSVMDDTEIPKMDSLNKYMMPNGWFATSDDTGYHFLWFQKRYQR